MSCAIIACECWTDEPHSEPIPWAERNAARDDSNNAYWVCILSVYTSDLVDEAASCWVLWLKFDVPFIYPSCCSCEASIDSGIGDFFRRAICFFLRDFFGETDEASGSGDDLGESHDGAGGWPA